MSHVKHKHIQVALVDKSDSAAVTYAGNTFLVGVFTRQSDSLDHIESVYLVILTADELSFRDAHHKATVVAQLHRLDPTLVTVLAPPVLREGLRVSLDCR